MTGNYHRHMLICPKHSIRAALDRSMGNEITMNSEYENSSCRQLTQNSMASFLHRTGTILRVY